MWSMKNVKLADALFFNDWSTIYFSKTLFFSQILLKDSMIFVDLIKSLMKKPVSVSVKGE